MMRCSGLPPYPTSACAMKLLAISHPCVTPINQAFFAAIEQFAACEVTLIVPETWNSKYGKIESVERLPSFRGKIITIPVLFNGNIPIHFYRGSIQKIIKQVSPDFIFVHHDPHTSVAGQFILENRTSIPFGFYAAQNINKSYPFPFSWFEKKMFSQASIAFPLSHSVLEVLRSKGYRNDATVLPLPFDASLFQPNSERRQRMRSSLGISPDTFIVGYLGRLTPEKGVDLIIDALLQLQDKQWAAVIAGSGPEEEKLRTTAQRAAQPSRFHFVGYVPHEQAASILNCFDVLVVPSRTTSSWKEQFGRVIIEAMACGVPVIGSDSGEIPFLIDQTQGGTTFTEDDPTSLARRISNIIDNREYRDELSERGLRSAQEHFTTQSIARQFYRSVSEVIDSSREKLSTKTA